jgi:hypothetical protein
VQQANAVGTTLRVSLCMEKCQKDELKKNPDSCGEELNEVGT